ncbi:type I DNA topoisomerase [candidate division KSB1 bacterium]|nr:type I DNA topoisomerase [candidate division KSB1 bacterium]
MPTSVVIVESVAKTKTIKKFLGKNYKVLSSVGHIKDLPKRSLGIDIEDSFQPQYITIRGKGKVLSDLKKAASSADSVYIATDPDREGEAIAWHIFEEIKTRNKNIHRILFNEITERAVVEAINHPLDIAVNKVEAQKARRVLDRLVGYKISPILWQTIYRGLSAGRVQSVALRLIVEREREVLAFVPQEYWSITAKLQGKKSDAFLSNLIKIQNKKPDITNERSAKSIVDDLKIKKFAVKNITKKQVTRKPAPPFTTSTLQQAAAQRLGYSAKKIMAIAQQLYEGTELGDEGSVGLITYMRTDSTRIADEAIAEVREFIASGYGVEYVPKTARVFKVKKGAQDAHETIRPTSMQREPKKIKKFLTGDQFKLYELIWKRFVACQMSDAKLDQTTIDIKAGVLEKNEVKEEYLFRTTGSIITFRGFLQAYEDFEENDNKKDNESEAQKLKIPENLVIGEILSLLDLIPKQHFTKPPARFSESSLVKELDALGIGRPSTYALIISTLLMRKYIEKNARQLIPTELGFTVCDILIQHFPAIFNTQFTAKMEEELDEIEDKNKDYATVINDFYSPFDEALEAIKSKKETIRDSLIKDTEEACPECGKALIERWGRNGKFIGCSGYPDCRYTKPLAGEEVTTDEICEKCGKPMVVKIGRYGRFIACSGYPECKNNKPFSMGIACPKDGCAGKIVERKTKRGKTFYGCGKYPDCDFASWYKPVSSKCKNCHSTYLEQRYNKSIGNYLYCPNCKTKYEQSQDDE